MSKKTLNLDKYFNADEYDFERVDEPLEFSERHKEMLERLDYIEEWINLENSSRNYYDRDRNKRMCELLAEVNKLRVTIITPYLLRQPIKYLLKKKPESKSN